MSNTLPLDPESIKNLAKLILPHLTAEEREKFAQEDHALLNQEYGAGRLKISEGAITWNTRESWMLKRLQSWVDNPTTIGDFQGSEIVKAMGLKNPNSDDYRTLARLMAELGWSSRKNAKGTLYSPQRTATNIPMVPTKEYPWILAPVQLGAKWDSPEHDGQSLVDDLNKIIMAIPDRTKGVMVNPNCMFISLPPEAHDRVNCCPMTAAGSDSVLSYATKVWAMPQENVRKVWDLSAANSDHPPDNFPILLKDRAIVQYIEEGRLLAHLVVEWAD